jgi:cellulose biosynthesis protein BcsQ
VTSQDVFNSKALTVINVKGGVGKTHTVWVLTGVCIERGKKLLAVDTDTQANLTKSLLSEPLDGLGIEALFDPAADARVQDLIRPTRFTVTVNESPSLHAVVG